MIKSKKVFSIIYLVIITLLSFGIILAYVNQLIPDKSDNDIIKVTNYVGSIDAKIKAKDQPERKISLIRSIKNRVSNRITKEISKLDSNFNEILFKKQLTDLNGGIFKILNKKVIVGANPAQDIYKLKNGMLINIDDGEIVKEELEKYASNMQTFKKYCDNKSIDFLNIIAPCRNSKYENIFYAPVKDYAMEKADLYISQLAEKNVDYIDLRKGIHEAGINQNDLFFRRDHHWTPEGGFLSGNIIIKDINERYGYKMKILNEKDFTFNTYKNHFHGDFGNTGEFYTLPDDFTLITPDFKTDFNISIPFRHISKTGSYRDTLIDMSEIEKGRDYVSYLYVDSPEVIIENNLNQEGKDILFITDSFGRVVAPFMSLNSRKLYYLDIRYYENFNLYNYIDKTNPDLVVFLFNERHMQIPYMLRTEMVLQ